MKVEAHIRINPIGPTTGLASISYCPHDPSILIVTGGGLYKYFVHKEKTIEEHHSAMNEKQIEVSDTYCCHTWSSDGQLVVCTEMGEIIVCQDNGEFKLCLEDSPIF